MGMAEAETREEQRRKRKKPESGWRADGGGKVKGGPLGDGRGLLLPFPVAPIRLPMQEAAAVAMPVAVWRGYIWTCSLPPAESATATADADV